jgi:MFS family permease
MDDESPAAPRSPFRSALSLLRYRTFRSLRHRNYRLYFFGQLVSFTGSWMQSAALMWLVFDLTSDPLWPPALLAAQVGPTLFLGTLGGALADRLPKRRLVFATQAAFMLTAGLLTALVAADLASPWLVLGILAVNGVIQAIDLPARLAFVPDLVPRDDLINAVGLNSLLFNAARAVGPAVAGVLFLLAARMPAVLPGATKPVTLGAVWCLALNTLSYAAVLGALRRIDVPGEQPGSARPADDSIWGGFRYLAAHPLFAGIVVLTGWFSVFAWPTLTLLPAYTRFVLGLKEEAYSWLVSALGGGALVGAVATATFGTEARRGTFLLAGAVCGLVGLIGLARVHTFPAAFGCCLAMGFGLILYLSTGQSALQLAVPDATRGRVMALWAMTLSASAPVGHLLAGVAAQRFAVPQVLAVMAGGVAVTTAGLLVLLRAGLAHAQTTVPAAAPGAGATGPRPGAGAAGRPVE